MKCFLFPTVHDFFALCESFRQQLMSMHKIAFHLRNFSSSIWACEQMTSVKKLSF